MLLYVQEKALTKGSSKSGGRNNSIEPNEVDSVIMGCVISTLKTSNLAREAALTSYFKN